VTSTALVAGELMFSSVAFSFDLQVQLLNVHYLAGYKLVQMTLNHPVKVNEVYYMRQDFTWIEMTMPIVRCSRSTNG